MIIMMTLVINIQIKHTNKTKYNYHSYHNICNASILSGDYDHHYHYTLIMIKWINNHYYNG